MLTTPNYTVHVGSGKTHQNLGTFFDRSEAMTLANFERQMTPIGVPVFVVVSS